MAVHDGEIRQSFAIWQAVPTARRFRPRRVTAGGSRKINQILDRTSGDALRQNARRATATGMDIAVYQGQSPLRV